MKPIPLYVTALLFTLVLFSGCNKEVGELPPSNDPVFHVSGTFGSENVEVIAGENGAYMNTYVESVKGVNCYKGKLGSSGFEIELGIYSGDIDIAGIAASNIVNTSQFKWACLSSEPLVRLSKDSLTNSSLIESIKWFIDGVQAGVNDVNIYRPGKYNICALVKFNDQTQSNVCNELIVGYEKNAAFRIQHFLGQNSLLKSWVEVEAGQIANVRWLNDGEYIAEGQNMGTVLNEEQHTIEAEVSFTNGAKRNRSILIDGSLSGKYIDDFARLERNNIINWDYKAILKIRKDGVDYSSLNGQNEDQSIDITSISYFGKNANGQPVYILKGKLRANVRALSTYSIPVDLDISFGIVLPE
jgi:hypothetical protein